MDTGTAGGTRYCWTLVTSSFRPHGYAYAKNMYPVPGYPRVLESLFSGSWMSRPVPLPPGSKQVFNSAQFFFVREKKENFGVSESFIFSRWCQDPEISTIKAIIQYRGTRIINSSENCDLLASQIGGAADSPLSVGYQGTIMPKKL